MVSQPALHRFDGPDRLLVAVAAVCSCGLRSRWELTSRATPSSLVTWSTKTSGAGGESMSRASSLAPQDVPALEETEPSIRMAAQLINVIDALQQLVDRSADETFAWSVIDAVRSEVEAMGGRADSLLRELVLIYQAVEIVRQRR